jgi:carbonic anhydrase
LSDNAAASCDVLRNERKALVISANEALEQLRAGNRRFVEGDRSVDTMSQARLTHFVAAQRPLAVILGCSDSRVPVEIVFDQGFGDLFVIRVAGNVVAPSQIGSVEFAVERLGTRLVVVLGHTRCGAVQATIEDLRESTSQSWNMNSIVSRIRPSVEGLLATDLRHDETALMEQAVRANVRASVNQLRHGSDVLERLARSDGLRIVGAEYALESGVVDFFDVA